MSLDANGVKAFAHLFLAGIVAAIVYSALQTYLLGPVESGVVGT